MDNSSAKTFNRKSCEKKVVLVDEKSKHVNKILKHPLKSNVSINLAVRNVNPVININKPQPITLQKNTILKIEKKIIDTKNAKFKPFKNTTELPPHSQTTLEGKITKHMNFPMEKKLYKQLITLNLTEKQPSQTSTVSYEPSVKDREPKLENYFCPKFGPEHPIPACVSFPSHSCTRTNNPFRIYQIRKSWKKF